MRVTLFVFSASISLILLRSSSITHVNSAILVSKSYCTCWTFLDVRLKILKKGDGMNSYKKYFLKYYFSFH